MAHKEYCDCQTCARARTGQTVPRRRSFGRDLLATTVAEQIEQLTGDLPFSGREELPAPADYDRYVVAYPSAIRRCDHLGSLRPTAMEMFECLTCGRLVSATSLYHMMRWYE